MALNTKRSVFRFSRVALTIMWRLENSACGAKSNPIHHSIYQYICLLNKCINQSINQSKTMNEQVTLHCTHFDKGGLPHPEGNIDLAVVDVRDGADKWLTRVVLTALQRRVHTLWDSHTLTYTHTHSYSHSLLTLILTLTHSSADSPPGRHWGSLF